MQVVTVLRLFAEPIKLVFATTTVSLIALAASPNAVAQTLTARYTPIANFAYQLDCVANVLPSCAGRNDYAKLWRETFAIDPAASNEVKRWRELRREHSRMAQPNFSLIQPGWPYSTIAPDSRVIGAGLGARDLSDYQSRLSLLMHDSLSAEASEVVAILYRPFERWWNANLTPPGHVKAQEIIARMNRDDMRDELKKLNALYGNPPGARREALLHLMFRPGRVDAGHTGGQNIGVDSFAEFMADEDLRYRIPVIVHEYAHFVFGTTTISQAKTLRAAIIKEGGEVGGPAWGLINEGLATAIGNGRVQRLLISAPAFEQFAKQEGSFYNEPFIDGTGKALLPVLDQMVTNGTSIHDAGFAKRYVELLKNTFGARLNAPSAHFNELVIVIDPALDSDRAMQLWGKHIRSDSRWNYNATCCGKEFLDNLNAQSGVARVMLVPAASVARIDMMPESARTLLEKSVKTRGAAIYVSRKSGEPPLVVIALANSNAETLESAYAALAAAPELREGEIAVNVAVKR